MTEEFLRELFRGLDWGTVPQWISAVTASMALYVAWSASKAWQHTLTSRRKEDAVASVHDLSAALENLQLDLGSGGTPAFGKMLESCIDNLKAMEKCCAIAGKAMRSDYKQAVEATDSAIIVAKVIRTHNDPDRRLLFHEAGLIAQDKIKLLRYALEKDLKSHN